MDRHGRASRDLATPVVDGVDGCFVQGADTLAVNDENNGLNNSLLVRTLLNGHVATQVLAIRRLMDDGNSDIISLRRLVKDLKRNFGLFTRENYVCFDGLPFDYEAVQHKEMMERATTCQIKS